MGKYFSRILLALYSAQAVMVLKFISMNLVLGWIFVLLVFIAQQFSGTYSLEWIEWWSIPAATLWSYLHCFFPGGYHWTSVSHRAQTEQKLIIKSLMERVEELYGQVQYYDEKCRKLEAELEKFYTNQ